MATKDIDRYVDEQYRSGIALGERVRVKRNGKVGEVSGISEVFGVNVIFHDEGKEETYKFYELVRI